ncbi:hypothetical protein OB955_09975 [Halobacteria archaeon AArc-m2/3/4]|uniref:SPW repeat-containing integral membrane domain-containing protein n=1 Tax=Natronoglomus mannanivorans TaxID=2979990 RepID=A0AAP2YUS5_9EURY|nr:hypothetical protein [Halobacteria archaeon AArc-xg1-1]MCU4973069.1 hypothetical protein [Halobacteria archaeon AArc-m2/3/4]
MSEPNPDDGAGSDRDSGGASDSGSDSDSEVRTPTDIESGTGFGSDSDRTSASGSDRDPDPDRDPRDDSNRIANEERRRNTPVVSGIITAIGAWVALSVLVLEVGEASLWNNVLVGAVIFLAAGYNYYRLNNDVPLSIGVASLVTVLGIWLIVATALIGMVGALFWSTAVSGLLVALLAGYNAYEAREARAVMSDRDVAG